MDSQLALKNLIDIKGILEKLEIPFWLEAGTCLGSYRDKGFISYDLDTDLGVYAESINTKEKLDILINELLSKGFKVEHTYGTLDNGFEVAAKRDNIKTDIFWFYKKGELRWHSAFLGDKQLYYVYPSVIIENLRDIIFLGTIFKVPRDTEMYLSLKYGDWQIPVQKWNWAYSPLNRVENI